jgi:hypothetical protein
MHGLDWFSTFRIPQSSFLLIHDDLQGTVQDTTDPGLDKTMQSKGNANGDSTIAAGYT